jgi:RNA recognition motif-containing protein
MFISIKRSGVFSSFNIILSMNLYVGNLSPETTEADLRTIFSEFGEIVSVKILLDPVTGLPRGFGFVEMADKYHGYDAITNLDMIYYQGNIINVRESKPKGNDSRGGGGGYNNRGGGGNRGGYNNNRSGGGGYNSGGGNRTSGSGRARTQSTYSRERNFNSDRSATGGGERANNFNRADNDFNKETNYNKDTNSGNSLYNTDEDLNFNKL